MNGDKPTSATSLVRLLEGITAGILILVVVALAWMIGAAYAPAWLRLASPEIEVVVVLALLSGALGLVSFVALWHTRPRKPSQP
jgi:hypothetical protein